MQVEDHPVDYADFEGVIPAGSTARHRDVGIMGSTHQRTPRMFQGAGKGELKFTVLGKKSKGRSCSWRSVSAWLLINHRDICNRR